MRKKDKEMKCPICGETKFVGKVSTMKQGTQLAVIAYYCRECCKEFDKNGRIFPYLYA